MAPTAANRPGPQRAATVRAAQAAQTRQRIIAAAVQLYSSQGFDDVSAADIAQAAGVAHGLVFHYFGSKRGIYLEALREAGKQLVESFHFDPQAPPSRQLRRAFRTHLEYLRDHRGLALRLVLGGRGGDPQAWEVYEEGRWRAIDATTAMLDLDPGNQALRMTNRAAVSAIDEATVYWLSNGELFQLDTMVEYMISLITAALESAATIDPTLDVSKAIDALRNPSAEPPLRMRSG